MRELVGEVVREKMDKTFAARFLRNEIESLPQSDRARLLEKAEVELQGLHEGNFARYRVRPSQFAAWKKGWR